MYNQDKQTNKNAKLHAHQAQGSRMTPPENCCHERNLGATLSKAFLNSNNNNDNDMDKNTSNNNSNFNKNDMIIIMMIKQRNVKPKDTNNKYY